MMSRTFQQPPGAGRFATGHSQFPNCFPSSSWGSVIADTQARWLQTHVSHFSEEWHTVLWKIIQFHVDSVSVFQWASKSHEDGVKVPKAEAENGHPCY